MPGATVGVYSTPARIAAGMLVAISRASAPGILALVVLANDPPITTPALVTLTTLFALAPAFAAWLLAWRARATLSLTDAALVVRGRGLRIEIPCASIGAVEPWVIPLPGVGLSLRMRSGRRLQYGFQVDNPTTLLGALADVAGVEAARAVADHASVVYAHAKKGVAPRRWYHGFGKFVAFALLPTLVLFNLHQHIAYGGTFGEYYLLGFASFVRTFVIYWGTVSIYLVLYAGTWRVAAEGVALAAAWVAPSRAARVRRMVEIGCRLAYYGGVPLLLALRFLA